MYQPFYMQYPMYGIWDEQQQCMKDYEYMRQMYPREIAKMQDCVEDVCDRMEYDGSVMYEEYPDRVSMILLRNEIMERMRNEQSLMDEFAVQETSQEVAGQSRQRDSWIAKMIDVLLCNEFCRRRQRRRKYR